MIGNQVENTKFVETVMANFFDIRVDRRVGVIDWLVYNTDIGVVSEYVSNDSAIREEFRKSNHNKVNHVFTGCERLTLTDFKRYYNDSLISAKRVNKINSIFNK